MRKTFLLLLLGCVFMATAVEAKPLIMNKGNLKPVQWAEIDHLSIRNHQPGKLIYENDSRKYYLITVNGGYSYFVAIHNVGTDEAMVERVFQEPSGQFNPLKQKEYIYSDKELEIFRRHLLPEFLKRRHKRYTSVYHYNANILLEDTLGPFERPLLITDYRLSNTKRVQKKIETKGQWYFSYSRETINEHGLYSPEWHFVSVDQALQYRKIKTKDLVSANEQAKKKLKGEKKALAAELEIKKGLIAKKRAERQLGIVHKSKNFWESFVGFDEAQSAFEGKFSGLMSNLGFMLQYANFQSVYYNNCKSSLSANSVSRGYSSQVVVSDGWGNEKYRERPVEYKIYIEPRFVDKYDEYYDRVDAYMARRTLKKLLGFPDAIREGLKDHNGSLSSATAGATKKYLASEPIIQMTRFFKGAECHSATMYQMRENLWRAAHNKPSLQAEGFKIPNAEKESISVEKAFSEKTIYQACLDDRPKPNDRQKFCRCFSRESRKVMTAKELAYFSEDFSRYSSDVLEKLDDHPPAKDRAWTLYKPIRNCGT